MRRLILFGLMVMLGSTAAVAQQNLFLVARTIGQLELSDGNSVRIFGFNTTLFAPPLTPGPTLEMIEGDSIILDFFNFSQGAPHTIHLHGLDVNQENDGVPHLSFEVHHMDTGTYRFRAPHAGTYLYHCHVISTIHVQAGMYGLIIVRPPDGSNTTWDGGTAFDQEHLFFTSEIDTTWHNDSVLNHDYDTSMMMHPVPVPVYHPQHFLINGLSNQQLDDSLEVNTSVGAVNYLRVANIGYCGNRYILPAGLNAEIVASDGRPLPQVEISDTLEVYPGERFGILGTATTEFLDSIAIEYIDMNTGLVKDVQYIQVSVEGTFTVPEPLVSAANWQLLPNPTDGNASLLVESPLAEQVSVRILNLEGKLVAHLEKVQIGEGSQRIPLLVDHLAPGLYMVEVHGQQLHQTLKLIRQ